VETVSCNLKKIELRWNGPALLIKITFDYGKEKRSYLPKEWKWQGEPKEGGEMIHKILSLADKREWGEVNNSLIRIRCDFDKLLYIGHKINDEWLATKTD